MNQSRASYLRQLLLLPQRWRGAARVPVPAAPRGWRGTGGTGLAEGRMRFAKDSVERVLLRGRNHQTSVLKSLARGRSFAPHSPCFTGALESESNTCKHQK